MKVGIVNLGCPKNLVDAEEMLGAMAQSGYELCADVEEADAIIVNTCGFIRDAQEESVEAIRKVARAKRQGRCKAVVVSGCLAQRYPEQIKARIPQIDAVVGIGQHQNIVEVLDRVTAREQVTLVTEPRFFYNQSLPRLRATPPWTAYLKIAEGCDNPCAFCAIPLMRGKFTSRPMEHLVEEARAMAAEGVREINLIAQDPTRYGDDLYGEERFCDLLKALAAIEDLRWIRLLYLYPSRVGRDLVEMIAREPKICKYVDIPMQHADPRILRLMKRGGRREQYLEMIGRLRALCPDIAIRSAFIVGFPGEKEEHFESLLDFIQEARLDRVGVFRYSAEEGTPSAEYEGQVKPAVAARRYDRLMRLQQKVSLEKNRAWVGREIDVLIESAAPDDSTARAGRSFRDAPDIDGLVYVRRCAARSGEFVRARIVEASEYDLIAEGSDPPGSA
ncbi:MAG: 30S ribosomal protein S12 methylthiotransferase RimO [Armatimonadetes bacterium]|nr:30S ribosomal protein S12 methylthiotransferase RimO [Armatimonadota bacterium]